MIKSFGTPGPISDRTSLRALFLHALVASDIVTALRFADDALLEPTAVAPTKAVDAPKKARKKPGPAVAHPDRGPSRIAALRAAIAGGSLPWAAEGAPAGSIPADFGGAPLAPTLREWLTGGDATWPVPRERPLEPRSFAEALTLGGPAFAEVFGVLGETLLAGDVVPLWVPPQCGDGTVLFLFLPFADATGEAPVIGFDPADEGIVGVFATRFDHYLARALGADRQPWSFGPLPGAEAYTDALVARLPAKQQKALGRDGTVLSIGALL